MKSISSMLLLLALGANAQQRPAAIVSPEVSPDRRVTFRLKAPNAKEVRMNSDFGPTLQLSKDEAGVWSVTTPPLAPDLYWYVFIMDGQGVADPSNPRIKTQNGRGPENLVPVPGGTPQPWFETDVAHGAITEHWYKSAAVGTLRNVLVYTPPGYNRNPQARYPVLYLLHGMGDDARSWTMVGRAHVILDNLIAEKKVVPMVIVMPDGMMPRGASGGGSDQVFERDLLNDIKPLVESEYRITGAREDRAIAGLSMGGGQAMSVGLSHPELFAYVGIFSSGNMASGGVDRFAGILADPEKANRQFRVLYLSCGLEDSRIEGTRKVDAALTAKGVHHIFKAEPGGHAFIAWRRDLTEFTPLLFRK